jgi:cytochrome c5
LCLWVFLFKAVLLIPAPPAHAQERVWDGIYTAAQAARGKLGYDQFCSRCHNVALTGAERGPAIKGSEFLSKWEKDTIGGLFTKIRDTMPQGRVGTVADADNLDILTYILQQNGFPPGTTELKNDIASLDEIRMSKRSIWDGVFTAAQADRGKAALLQNGCNGCHGAELEGSRGPSLKGERFIEAWQNGSLNRLFTKIRDTMPPLNAEQVPVTTKVDIIAHLLAASGFPPGSTELKLDSDVLEGILIAKKGAESTGPPNFTLVQVVGCLTERPNKRWALTNATEPVATRDETRPPNDNASAINKGPGMLTFELISVRSAFKPELHMDHRMEARGLLYRDGDYAELNLTSLDMVGPGCGN